MAGIVGFVTEDERNAKGSRERIVSDTQKVGRTNGVLFGQIR